MLVKVAAVYRNAVADQQSPVAAVAAEFGISQAAAKMRIMRAKQAGTLAARRVVLDEIAKSK